MGAPKLSCSIEITQGRDGARFILEVARKVWAPKLFCSTEITEGGDGARFILEVACKVWVLGLWSLILIYSLVNGYIR